MGQSKPRTRVRKVRKVSEKGDAKRDKKEKKVEEKNSKDLRMSVCCSNKRRVICGESWLPPLPMFPDF